MNEVYLWQEFRALINDVLLTETVQRMREHNHHFDITCYEHCVFVAYIAFRIARKWGLDERVAARAGLLHDLYLYDPAIMGLRQCAVHPIAAFENAQALCPDLTDKEGNAIRSHMFPLAKEFPKSREALAVNMADKFCATVETLKIFARLPVRQLVQATWCEADA